MSDTSEIDAQVSAAVQRNLRSGRPAFFHTVGNGSYICGVDGTYGVPIRLAGDVVSSELEQWIRSSNLGVVAHIERHGLPWNSRAASLSILNDLKTYFRDHASEVTRLPLNGDSFSPQGQPYTLSLVPQKPMFSWEGPQTAVKVEAVAMLDADLRRFGSPDEETPDDGITVRPPRLSEGTESVWLRFYEGAACVECVPGPPDSNIAIFRFSEFAPDRYQRREPNLEFFDALDIQLADWIMGTSKYFQIHGD